MAEGLLGTGGLIYKLICVVVARIFSSFLSVARTTVIVTWAPPQGCLSILRIQQVVSPTVSKQRVSEQGKSHNVFYSLD